MKNFASGNGADFNTIIPVDQVGVEERVSRLNKRSIKKGSKIQVLKMALSMADLTTLEGMDTKGKVIQLCQKARRPHAYIMPGGPINTNKYSEPLIR